MDNNIIHLFNLNGNEELVTTKRKRIRIPRFTMIGNDMKSLDIIAQFTKPEAFTFIHLKDNRDYENNVVEFNTAKLTATEKVIFSRGYKLLEEKNLIIRLKKGRPSIYLFNPDFIIPKNYEEAKIKYINKKEPNELDL